MRDALKLTTYFGERHRHGSSFLGDALLSLYARHGVATSVLLRGAEGFGLRHRLRTSRVLTLSEDLPLVAVAIDERARIEGLLDDALALHDRGLVTLERCGLVSGGGAPGGEPGRDESVRLSVFCGRREQVAGRPAHVAVVAALRRHGAAGATALLGVDGTRRGERERARLVGRNADVPVLVLAIGDAGPIEDAVREIERLLPHPVMTFERVTVMKRDGVRSAVAPPLPDGWWRKFTVLGSEQARADGQPLHTALVRALRETGASGATAVRGVWGYRGAQEPHGDRFWSLRRHVPVLTVTLDDAERSTASWRAIDDLTADAGLVVCESVPAARAAVPGGRLRLPVD